MRKILLDLSADDIGAQYRFAGFGGEHNATSLTVILPERMKKEGAEYRFLFETSAGEAIFSAPVPISEDGSVSVLLTKSLMTPPVLNACVGCYVTREGEVVLAAKSSPILLGVQKSPEETGTEQSENGGSVPGLVIDASLSGESKNPVENRAVFAALQGKLNRSDYVVDGEIKEKSKNPVENQAVSAALSKKMDRKDYVVDDEVSEKSQNPLENRVLSRSFAGAVRREVSGEGVLLDPVSKIPHEVEISLSEKNGRVLKYGKNLCPVFRITTAENLYGQINLSHLKHHGTYYLSCLVTREEEDMVLFPCLSAMVYYTDGTVDKTSTEVSFSSETPDGMAYKKELTFVTDEKKEISNVVIRVLDCGSYNRRDAKAEEIFLTLSETQTEYEPYQEPIILTANGEGKILGIVGNGEAITLLGENGVKITAVYNRDVDALLESLGKRKNVSYVKSGVLYLKEVRS